MITTGRGSRRRARNAAHLTTLVLVALISVGRASGQESANAVAPRDENNTPANVSGAAPGALVTTGGRTISPNVALYFDPQQGTSANDLVRRALTANGELAAARLEATRARARLRQAGLRPNPTIDFEQTTGRLTGSGGESETSIGVALPLEIGGRRQRRIELAQAELEATEAEIADRERRLAGEVRALYAEALAALRGYCQLNFIER